MKKKTVMAMLVMCMALSAAACADGGNKESSQKETGSTETAEADKEETKEEKTDGKKEDEKEEASVRLVSVDDISKYVTVGEYKGLELDKVTVPVSDEDIDAEIEFRLQENPVEVPDASVEEGDRVRINYTGTVDGKTIDGGTQENYDLVVGGESIAEGFDDGLIGMKKGETKEISVTFPEEYYDSELAGKAAVYQVTLQSVSRTPELTDQWVAENTESKTIEEYRNTVRKDLENYTNEAAELQLYADAWNTVLENSEIIEYPEEDVQKAAEAYKALNGEYIEQAQMDMSEFLKAQGLTEEEYEAECRQYAETKVEQNLIVQYIMDQEGLSLEDDAAKELQTTLFRQYGVTDLSEIVDIYGQTEVDESLALLRVEKFIADNAEIDEKVGSGDDLAQNEDALTEEDVYDTVEEDTAIETEDGADDGEAPVVEE
nr:trigger factor [uncultured Blautia sp.]